MEWLTQAKWRRLIALWLLALMVCCAALDIALFSPAFFHDIETGKLVLIAGAITSPFFFAVLVIAIIGDRPEIKREPGQDDENFWQIVILFGCMFSMPALYAPVILNLVCGVTSIRTAIVWSVAVHALFMGGLAIKSFREKARSKQN